MERRELTMNDKVTGTVIGLVFIITGLIAFAFMKNAKGWFVGFFAVITGFLFIYWSITSPIKKGDGKRDYYLEGNKRCVVCGRNIRTGWKYCWEHRGVGKYGGDVGEWESIRENKRYKKRRNKTERRAEGVENLSRAFGILPPKR
ncbi:MAG: hypothetical protein KJ600_05130 [Nanoarchaeota archaeon]|nr:hypothetical protein [Nanoarchaeota archaeon]MBU1103914.1 hypothetical protein [Nanoarchaeota archaeon]